MSFAERASPAGMRPSRPSAVSFPSGSSQKSQKSARHAFNPLDDPRPIPFKFLSTHHLVITTAQGVYTCGSHGITEVFRSGSKGIVAAKRASSGSAILAVADDHLLILHDVRKGMQSTYRLRSADVCHRCSLLSLGLQTFVGSRAHAQICKEFKLPFLHHLPTRRGAGIRSGAIYSLGFSVRASYISERLCRFLDISSAALCVRIAPCDSADEPSPGHSASTTASPMLFCIRRGG